MSSLSDTERRALMARFRGRDTKPEVLVRQSLHRLGRRFRLHRRDLPGRPDIVLPRDRTAIFVHGCFWHAHEGCPSARVPKTKPEFWAAKFAGNRARDARVTAELEAMGWRVVTLWECEILGGNVEEILRRLNLAPRPSSEERPDGVAAEDRAPHVNVMNGYIIATQRPDANSRGGRLTTQWIGITATFQDMVARTAGREAHLVSDGADVLRKAREMGLQDGEVRQLND